MGLGRSPWIEFHMLVDWRDVPFMLARMRKEGRTEGRIREGPVAEVDVHSYAKVMQPHVFLIKRSAQALLVW